MAATRSGPQIADLVAEHHGAVYGYAYRLTGSVADAEDLTQQVFVVALRKVGQIRSVGSARAWLFAILRNCFLRDRQRLRPTLATDVSLRIDSVSGSLSEEEVDREMLQDVLDRLPEAHRLVVVMFYFEECSYREIAEKLGVPIGTVMSRLARARRQLRALVLEPEDGKPRRPMGAAKHG